jgi:hypothetical protein
MDAEPPDRHSTARAASACSDEIGFVTDCPYGWSCEQKIGNSAEKVAQHLKIMHAKSYEVVWGEGKTKSAPYATDFIL